MNTAAALRAYNNVGVESNILGADPHQLVTMLYDGALLAIGRAKEQMAEKMIESKGLSISKAIAIIGEGLNASLDKSAGGDLAVQLSNLYGYMVQRLVQANISNDPDMLDEVSRMLSELREAWVTIRPEVLRVKGYTAPA